MTFVVPDPTVVGPPTLPLEVFWEASLLFYRFSAEETPGPGIVYAETLGPGPQTGLVT